MSIATILPYIQIVISVLLIAGVLLQYSAAGVGGALGGSDSFEAGYHTRRGFEKFLFNATIILAILFAATSLVSFLY
ncbi:MAG: preprotein translocase subunit SecG [bacterium]